jgi:hypothetical protein
VGQSNPQRRVDSSMNLLVAVAILPECDLDNKIKTCKVPKFSEFPEIQKKKHAKQTAM